MLNVIYSKCHLCWVSQISPLSLASFCWFLAFILNVLTNVFWSYFVCYTTSPKKIQGTNSLAYLAPSSVTYQKVFNSDTWSKIVYVDAREVSASRWNRKKISTKINFLAKKKTKFGDIFFREKSQTNLAEMEGNVLFTSTLSEKRFT